MPTETFLTSKKFVLFRSLVNFTISSSWLDTSPAMMDFISTTNSPSTKTVLSKVNFPLFSFTVPECVVGTVFTTLYPHHLISDDVTFTTLSPFF
ncbi:hypothetical protein [Chryseobacterium sp. POE27]|uniref:hypothetical protein n=1 Tax=Chryseobacterium sp. POE27 TaxID=3138177 RepID=UPI00321A3617